jgi:hypothetical protein
MNLPSGSAYTLAISWRSLQGYMYRDKLQAREGEREGSWPAA